MGIHHSSLDKLDKCVSYLKVKVKLFSRVRLFATPWTVVYQAPPSMGFSREEYWSGLPFPSPVDLPDPGIEPESPVLQADALTSEPPGKPHTHLEPNPKHLLRWACPTYCLVLSCDLISGTTHEQH